MSRCRGCDTWGPEGHWGPCANIDAEHPQPPTRPPTPEEQAELDEVLADTRTPEELARDLGIELITVPKRRKK